MADVMAGRKKRSPEEADLSGQPAGKKTMKEPTSVAATAIAESASRMTLKPNKVDIIMTNPVPDPVRRVSKMSPSNKVIMDDPVLGRALIAKIRAGWYDLLNDPVRRSALRDNHEDSIRAIYDDPVRGPACRAAISKTQRDLHDDSVRGLTHRAAISKSQRDLRDVLVRGLALRAKMSRTKQAVGDKSTRTKWRHAIIDPLLAADRRDVIVMPTGLLKTFAEKRLRHIDHIDKKGTIEQKRKFLKDVICKQIFTSFLFSSVSWPEWSQVSWRWGPEPQVQTDHESDENSDHKLDINESNTIVSTPGPSPEAEPTWKVIKMTPEWQQTYRTHRKELRAKEEANRTEDEKLIDLAKKKICTSRAGK